MAWVEAAVNPTTNAQPINPCGIQPKAANPRGAVASGPANAGAAAASDAPAPSPWLLRMMSLMAHLVYGGIVGSLYRRAA
jgi:hypothetical protein